MRAPAYPVQPSVAPAAQFGPSSHITTRDLGSLLARFTSVDGGPVGGVYNADGGLAGGALLSKVPSTLRLPQEPPAAATVGIPLLQPLPVLRHLGGEQAGDEPPPLPAPSAPAPPDPMTPARGQTLTPAITATPRRAGAETVNSRTGGRAVMAHAWQSGVSDAWTAASPSLADSPTSPGGHTKGFPLPRSVVRCDSSLSRPSSGSGCARGAMPLARTLRSAR
ncbi:hypothetical protein AURDEDRAFT_172887 [Auricularia subglabra TFB-10046 SS5]|nr:hypothetical protein AURDEDRAFT_172887 [Auricularia subglabra TFB-10046 SS5]